MTGTDDLQFFTLLSKQSSLSAAATALGITPPAVSRRLSNLENRLGVRLLNRSTRSMSLTPEGESYVEAGGQILCDLENLEQMLRVSKDIPRGELRVNATLGFGRKYLSFLVADFVDLYPEVEIFLQLTDKPLDFSEHGIDIGIRFGHPPDARVLARKISTNRRLICASPSYILKMGQPMEPGELSQHQCIILRENYQTNNWQLFDGKQQVNIKVRGILSTNHGEIAVDWALNGRGIIQRSEWGVGAHIQNGELCHVLPNWVGNAGDIYAVYPHRHLLSAKIRVFVDFLSSRFSTDLAPVPSTP